jgi:hypothetical protein
MPTPADMCVRHPDCYRTALHPQYAGVCGPFATDLAFSIDQLPQQHDTKSSGNADAFQSTQNAVMLQVHCSSPSALFG